MSASVLWVTMKVPTLTDATWTLIKANDITVLFGIPLLSFLGSK